MGFLPSDSAPHPKPIVLPSSLLLLTRTYGTAMIERYATSVTLFNTPRKQDPTKLKMWVKRDKKIGILERKCIKPEELYSQRCLAEFNSVRRKNQRRMSSPKRGQTHDQCVDPMEYDICANITYLSGAPPLSSRRPYCCVIGGGWEGQDFHQYLKYESQWSQGVNRTRKAQLR